MPAKLDRCVTSLMSRSDMRSKYPDEAERKSHAFAICRAATKLGEEAGVEEYGYFTQLSDDVPSRVHALSVKKFIHPVYGVVDITPERIQRFAEGVNTKVRGIDPDIDYRHKATDDKAAGWVKGAEVEGDKLFLNVEWTPAAAEAIKNKEFKYFSADFLDEWTDAAGQKHADVIAGGALTNRPFLKDLTPLNFDEFYFDISALDDKTTTIKLEDNRWVPETVDTPKGGNVDPKKLAEALSIQLEEDADEDKLFTEITKRETERENELKTLRDFKETAEKDTKHTKRFEEEFAEEAKQLKELREGTKLMETDTRINEWHSKGIAPAVDDKVREFRLSLDAETTVKFDEVVMAIAEAGIVSVEERGGDPDPTRLADAEKRFDEAVNKKLSEDKELDYKDAVLQVERDDPELAKAVREVS